MDLDADAVRAADPDAPIATRLAALVRVVEVLSLQGGDVPAAFADAVDDLAVVDAAISARRADIVCAALRHLRDEPGLATTRRRVVRRMVAAGCDGLAVAGLALEIGDHAVGARLAVRDFVVTIEPRVGRLPPDPLVRAWCAWLARLEDPSFVEVLRALGAHASAVRQAIAHATDVHAALIASRQAANERMLAPR